MAIFYPSKTGDAMGKVAFGRMSKKNRQEYAVKKMFEEERKLSGDYYALQRVSKKFRDTVRKQRKAAGLNEK